MVKREGGDRYRLGTKIMTTTTFGLLALYPALGRHLPSSTAKGREKVYRPRLGGNALLTKRGMQRRLPNAEH